MCISIYGMKTKLKVEDMSVLLVTLPYPTINFEECFVVLLLFSGPVVCTSDDSVTSTFLCTVYYSPTFGGASAASDRAVVGHPSGVRLNLHLPPLLQLIRGRGASSL